MSTAPATSDSSAGSSGERRQSEGRHRDRERRDAKSAFVPILVLAAAFLAWSVFQAIMLVVESKTLAKARENQEVQKKNADNVRQALDGLARDTARLADRGNAGARLIVDELRKRGVTINPDAPPPAKK